MTKEVPLTSTVEAHGEKITVLALREPRGKDIRQSGNPFQMVADRNTGEANPVFDADASARLLSNLAGVPLSTIDALSAADFFSAQLALLDFFGAKTPANGSPPTST